MIVNYYEQRKHFVRQSSYKKAPGGALFNNPFYAKTINSSRNGRTSCMFLGRLVLDMHLVRSYAGSELAL